MGYKGHIAGMLEKSGYGYWDTYLSSSQQDFSTADARAYGNDNFYYTQFNGTATKSIVNMTVSGGMPWSGNQPVTFAQLGTNAYMEWGTWTQTVPMSTSSGTYFFNNSGAYVWGTPTTDAEMNDLRKLPGGQGVYSGNAWGTYYAAGNPGTPLAGTFHGTVNFTNQTITDFNIDVSGGGKTVSIANATGNFPGATSSFVIDPNTGNWKIGATGAEAMAGNKSASGTVYGNTGQYVGGVWKGRCQYDRSGRGRIPGEQVGGKFTRGVAPRQQNDT
jgi:hypothetical protein